MRRIVFGIILTGLMFASVAHADPLVSRREALPLLGDLEQHFSKQPYSVLVLERRDRQPIYLEPVDAVLFSPGSGSFEKIQTRDRNHRLLLNSPTGAAGETLTGERLKRLLTLIKSNHMIPYVLKDENGMEQMVVFADPYNTCAATRTAKGILVSVEADPGHRAKTLEERAIWLRKY